MQEYFFEICEYIIKNWILIISCLGIGIAIGLISYSRHIKKKSISDFHIRGFLKKKILSNFYITGFLLFIIYLFTINILLKEAIYIFILSILFFATYLLVGIKFIPKKCTHCNGENIRCDVTITTAFTRISFLLFLISGIISVLIVIGEIIVRTLRVL